jgi:Fe-Mn family superoxide dismutase
MNNMALRNNAGGYFNHKLFWEVMNPNNKTEMSNDLSSAIDNSFGSFDNFCASFANAAATRFGSGWAWLCVKDGKLEICSTSNQDNPLMPVNWLWWNSNFRNRCLGACLLFKLPEQKARLC